MQKLADSDEEESKGNNSGRVEDDEVDEDLEESSGEEFIAGKLNNLDALLLKLIHTDRFAYVSKFAHMYMQNLHT